VPRYVRDRRGHTVTGAQDCVVKSSCAVIAINVRRVASFHVRVAKDGGLLVRDRKLLFASFQMGSIESPYAV